MGSSFGGWGGSGEIMRRLGNAVFLHESKCENSNKFEFYTLPCTVSGLLFAKANKKALIPIKDESYNTHVLPP